MSLTVTPHLNQLFKKHSILTLKQLQKFIGRSRRTLFRELSKLTYLSSYTHAGQFYTLESIAQFNSEGLWFFQGVGFSQHRTLKVTLIHKIHTSQAGYIQKELSHLLRIRVHDSLRILAQSKKIQRRPLSNNVFLYLSVDEQRAKKQFNQRIASAQAFGQFNLPSTDVQIEILAETIRYYLKVEVMTRKLMPGLCQRGVSVTSGDIEAVLVFYEVKKNKLGSGTLGSKTD